MKYVCVMHYREVGGKEGGEGSWMAGRGAGMLESMCLDHTKERKEPSEGESFKRAN